MTKKTFLLSISILWTMMVMAGGGWTQKKKEGFFKLSQYVIWSDRYYNPGGDVIDINPGISIYTTSLYAEYGLTDRLTAILYFPFFSTSILNALQQRNGDFVEGDQVTSLGDTDVGLKYGLIQNKSIVLSAKLTFGLPFGKAVGGRTQSLQTGDGEFNQMLTLEASHSFYPIPIYVSSALAFNNRTKGFSDEIRYGLEVGYTISKVTLVARFSGVSSLMNGTPDPNSTQGVFGNNIEYNSFSPEIIYSIKENIGVSASVGTAFSGREVLANPSYEVGFFMKI